MSPSETPPSIRPIPAGHVLLVVVGALVIGLFFNAGDILETAKRQPAGVRRVLAVGMMEPIAGLSRLLFLDRPRRVIDLALGREPEETAAAAPAPVITTNTTAPAATVTTLPGRRVVTTAEPLRMYIGGDSMVGQFGPMLQNRANHTEAVDSVVQYEFESGITRPDFVDWPARLRGVRQGQDPEVIVLFFGGNDAQPIQIDGTWFDFGTAEWLAEYRSRVGSLMTELEDDGRDVYWVGMPIVSSESFRERVVVMNEIYRSEAEERDRVHFIDSWPVFTGPDGEYSEYLADAAGDVVDMRLNDGVHLTTDGATRLAEVVFTEIDARWDLPEES